MDLTALARELQQGLRGEVRVREPLARHTTWRIGGPADLFARPETREEFEFCLAFARQKGLPLHIMGNGSNLLVRDSGVRGLVIQTRSWQEIAIRGQSLRACAGALIPRVLRVACQQGLGGLEFAAGIPATMGGAVVMNAGTPAGCLGDLVAGVELVTLDGYWHYRERRDITFAYRYSSLRLAGVVVAVDLRLRAADPGLIRARIQANLAGRRSRQPLACPNAGSVFKNPPADFAGRLIEGAGAKGWRVGQAQVSPQHANFIVNLGGATAADVLELIARVQQAVARYSGVALELEIEVWG
ncbi:MAG: UDP-N-acetylmuramate dehydrogenase [Clostridia bacterium]|nr:UDP-N-acetylmuramate dehydrogenase [Clostridia bacterium]